MTSYAWKAMTALAEAAGAAHVSMNGLNGLYSPASALSTLKSHLAERKKEAMNSRLHKITYDRRPGDNHAVQVSSWGETYLSALLIARGAIEDEIMVFEDDTP